MGIIRNMKSIAKKVETGIRLNAEEGAKLFEMDILELGRLANIARETINGRKAFYVVNRHVNHTNVCVNRCRFCAFSRNEGEDGAFCMTMEQILARADEAKEMGAKELHIVGGLHPSLPFDFYIEMLREIHNRHPQIHIQAFTAVEIAHLATISGLSVEQTLTALCEAGLGSLPGGGAEVFASRVRTMLCAEKLPGEQWLDVMRTAHRLGLRSNATMLYGHIETPQEKIDHLIKLRELQDETGGFLAFIPLSFHPENTDIPNTAGSTGIGDLRHIAIARLMLDNFSHIKAFWIMLGIKLAQVSLSFGADDMDGTVVEEKITHMAGARTPQGVTVARMRELIEEAGRIPIERDTLYNEVAR